VAAFRGRDVLDDDTARDTAASAATKTTKDKSLPSDVKRRGRDKIEEEGRGGGGRVAEEEEEEKRGGVKF